MERTSGGHLLQASYSGTATQKRLPRTTYKRLVSERKSPKYLWETCDRALSKHNKEVPIDAQREPPVF